MDSKKHWVSLWFDVQGKHFHFCGLVTGVERDGHLVVSYTKIFKAAFGFDLPIYSRITIL